jgi:hypothetical protein
MSRQVKLRMRIRESASTYALPDFEDEAVKTRMTLPHSGFRRHHERDDQRRLDRAFNTLADSLLKV